MSDVKVYTVPNCLDCAAIKRLLSDAGIPFDDVDISTIDHGREALALLSGLQSVPQVFVGNRFIGQVGEIRILAATGKLKELVRQAGRP